MCLALFEQLLQIDIPIAESRLRLAPRGLEQGGHFLQAFDLPHAFSAAASRGFDQQRKTDLRRLGKQFLVGHVAHILGPRDDWHTGLDHGRPRFRLVSHGSDGGWLGTNERDPGIGTGRGKILALGQKSITGMDSIRPAFTCNVDDLVRTQIGFARWRRSQQIGFIRITDVQCPPVSF